MSLLKGTANELDKPFYVGEAGVSVEVLGERGYAHPIARDGFRLSLEAMEILDVPLVLIWAWEDFCQPPQELNIRSDVHERVLTLLRETQNRWKMNRQFSRREISEETKENFQRLAQKWKEIVK